MELKKLQCSNCGKSDRVTIGAKQYCANCGTALSGVTVAVQPPKPVSQSPVKPKLTDLAPRKPATSFHARPDYPITNPTAPTPAMAAPMPLTTEVKKARRIEKATQVTQSDVINKFHPPATQPTTAPPASFVRPAAVAGSPAVLPNPVATKIEAAASLLPPTSTAPTAIQPTRAKSLKLANALAVLMIVGIMGGYIWLQNYPRMTVKLAAKKAGLEVHLPSYLPSSYKLSGPVTYGTGQITLTFASRGGSEPIKLTERKTSWDSAALLDHYVSRRTTDYLTVQSRGLTIYFYSGNQASWINQGIWYSLEGESRLNQADILKIIASL